MKPSFKFSIQGKDNLSWLHKNDRALNLDELIARYDRFIYCDNRDPSSLLQLDKWFRHGFFNKDNTLLILKSHRRGSAERLKFLKQENYNFILIPSPSILPPLIDKIVYYPINSYSNIEVVRHQSSKHVFIGHGDSDKQASINPIIKVYSHILVSGNLGLQRMLQHSLVNESHIKNGNIVEIGMPYEGNNEQYFNRCSKPITLNTDRIVYCPTWEGVGKDQRYSSLQKLFGAEFITKNFQENTKIFIKPHPSTGRKDKAYLDHLVNIVNKLAEKFDVTYINSYPSLDKHLLKHTKKLKNSQDDFDFDQFGLAIVDISSMLSNSIYKNVAAIALDITCYYT